MKSECVDVGGFISAKQNRSMQRDLASDDFFWGIEEKEANSLEDRHFPGIQVRLPHSKPPIFSNQIALSEKMKHFANGAFSRGRLS